MLQASDIWSLGVTLFSFVYGNVPWVAETIPALYSKIQTEPLVFPPKPTISPNLRDLIVKMLKKDPNERITLQEIKVKITLGQITEDKLFYKIQ